MSLHVHPRPDEPDAFDVFSGSFRVGVVRPLPASEIAPSAYCWTIGNILIGARSSGVAATADEAAAGMVTRWREWLRDAELAPIDGRTRGSSRASVGRSGQAPVQKAH
ncbi:hypothetical protein [Terrarubrum flagellatum]|uniref:hypothetical protein n=1 Tax=Terrirubrum flagellatum TaxID=2895980 RepID=UPI00314564A0